MRPIFHFQTYDFLKIS